MENQIQTLFNGFPVTVFGYATKSVPGLEINGLGRYGKGIKEKIIYITRTNGLQIPLRRFVLNVELPDDEMLGENPKYIELALLLQYWHLAGIITLPDHGNTIAAGSISPSGIVTPPPQDQIDFVAQHYDLEIIDAKKLTEKLVPLTFNTQE